MSSADRNHPPKKTSPRIDGRSRNQGCIRSSASSFEPLQQGTPLCSNDAIKFETHKISGFLAYAPPYIGFIILRNHNDKIVHRRLSA